MAVLCINRAHFLKLYSHWNLRCLFGESDTYRGANALNDDVFQQRSPLAHVSRFRCRERDCDAGALMLTSLLFFVLLAVAFLAIYGK